MGLQYRLVKAKTPKPKAYPYIAEGNYSGTVVMFTAQDFGTILAPGRNENKILKTGFTGIIQETGYIPYEGEIVLSN